MIIYQYFKVTEVVNFIFENRTKSKEGGKDLKWSPCTAEIEINSRHTSSYARKWKSKKQKS